jgi:uncharacterized protein (DUF1697 family)
MARFVALLRGVNVGRCKRVAMADLRDTLASLGYGNVRTLLNSGNAVFVGPAEPQARHAERIQVAIARELGVETLVIVKSARDMAAIVAGNEFADTATDPSRLLVAITRDARSLATLASMVTAEWGSDELQVGRHAAYVWCPKGILESKIAVALLGRLGESGTTRNWSTVVKLHALLTSPA